MDSKAQKLWPSISKIGVCGNNQAAGGSRRNYQFEGFSVRVYCDPVMEPNLRGNHAAKLVDAFKEAITIQTSGNNFIERARKLRVQRNLVLTLHQVAARGDRPGDGPDVGLSTFCLLQYLSS